MKMALLGGTFNPIHNGHIQLAEQVKLKFHYDKIVFVPSFIPAHKTLSQIISHEHRLEMLKLALENLEWAIYSDCEIIRKGISYTADTLAYIQQNYDLSEKPGLIIGDDLAAGFNSWKNPDKIIEMSNLIIAHRLYREEIPLSFSHRYINNSIFSLSSSEIREKRKRGDDLSGYIPEKVLTYICNKGLYLGEDTGN
jgi:nicotinate-nucleotide adenylyltransferase